VNSVRVSCCPEQHNCTGMSARRGPHGHDGRIRACRSRGESAVRSPGIRTWPRDFSVELNHTARQHIPAALACALRTRPDSCVQPSRFPRRGANDPINFGVNPDLGLVYPDHSARKIDGPLHLIVVFTQVLGITPRVHVTLARLLLFSFRSDKCHACSAADARKDADGDLTGNTLLIGFISSRHLSLGTLRTI
jgi:hypothetical protein